MRRFYAPKENFDSETVQLDQGETRHLRDVLRLRPGEVVQVFDGEGHEFLCAIDRVEKKMTRLAVVREVPPAVPESSLELTLAAAITKGEKFDFVVQKAVELGVTKLLPLFTTRCDVKQTGSEKRLERWKKIALDAAKQSGRARLMRIENPLDFESFVGLIAVRDISEGTVVLFSEREGISFSELMPSQKITAVIGPEGGWEDSELEAAQKGGFRIVTLGGRIMRAETAAIAVTAILQHRFGDIN